MRVLAGDIGADDESLAASLRGMRDDIAAARQNLEAAKALAPALPHRERYLRLVHGYGNALLDMHERWLDHVERELVEGSS